MTKTSQTANVTLQIVGPITRSTFQREQPDRIAESISDVMHWSWATRLQIDRLRQSFRAEFRALGLHPKIEFRRLSSATTYDEHLVFVAAANLDRALARAPRDIRRELRMPGPAQRALHLLRNVYEHWDQLRHQYRKGLDNVGRIKKLKAEFPDADPWTVSFDPATGEVVMAKIVPLTPFVKELRYLEAQLWRLERRRRRASRELSAERAEA